MFGKQQAIKQQEVTMISPPEPAIDITPFAPIDYIKTCEIVGARQISDVLRLHTLLSLEVGKIYDIHKVNRFLISHCPKGKDVAWKPLCGKVYKERRSWTYDNNSDDRKYVYLNPAPCYSKLVPERALRIVASIEKEIPDTFGHYVSDYDVSHPDPFLLVCHVPTNQDWVVYHWNEPDWKD